MSPLVDPPIACSTTCAFLNAALVEQFAGPWTFRDRHCRGDLAAGFRGTKALGVRCGMVALIGSDRPSASVMQAMVEAVPITMQVPTDGASGH